MLLNRKSNINPSRAYPQAVLKAEETLRQRKNMKMRTSDDPRVRFMLEISTRTIFKFELKTQDINFVKVYFSIPS